MSLVFDLAYAALLVLTSPAWMMRLVVTGKWRSDWPGRLGAASVQPPATGQRRILIHAVSVGEVNALRTLIDELRNLDPEVHLLISATTNTGIARAQQLFGESCEVCRFPLDFSLAVRRFLGRTRPDVVVLVELEVWPNFTQACAQRGVPVCVINGRLSERSHRRYRLVRQLLRSSFSRLAFAGVQSEAYAARFADMGLADDRIFVTDTMKWDAVQIAETASGADELAADLGIDRSKPLIVAGSTAPDEHALLHASTPEGVQLLCAPRRPEWFEQAAVDLPGCARRSHGDHGSATGRFLLDTLGELSAAYALADVVVIGRSFGALFGSDMMEPVALGKATVVGPAVSDFQETVDALLVGDGIVQTTRDDLAQVLSELLRDDHRRTALASKGRAVIRQRHGASRRHASMILELLGPKNPSSQQSWDDEGGERRKSK